MIEPSESDKRSIYKHPLFPLMALLFERCEQVTQTPDCPLVANLKVDIQSFVHHHQQRLVDFEQSIGERPEVDSLMIKAIQILWIHLLELDKVNELCKDFCTRYISCLRTKLQNEQLLHIDAFESDSNDVMLPSDSNRIPNNSNGNGGPMSYGDMRMPPHHQINMDNGQGMRRSMLDSRSSHPEMSLEDPNFYRHQKYNKNPEDSDYQHPTYMPPSDPVADQNSQPLLPTASPDLSQNGSRTGSVSPSIIASLEALDDGDYDAVTRQKKGVLPRQATRVLKTWLFQHIIHPYPTEEEKKILVEHTSLTLVQINNWFSNARRKILESSSDQDGPPKNKKMKSNNGSGPPGSPDKNRKSNSRSETSTPTSTTLEGDRVSLSQYSNKAQAEEEEEDGEKVAKKEQLESEGKQEEEEEEEGVSKKFSLSPKKDVTENEDGDATDEN